jgi:hypothetical protein
MWQTQMVLLEGKTLLVFVPVVFTYLLTNNIKHDKLTNNMRVEKLWKILKVRMSNFDPILSCTHWVFSIEVEKAIENKLLIRYAETLSLALLYACLFDAKFTT